MANEPNFSETIEQELDLLRTRVKLIEDALVLLPYVNFEADPSRPQGVRVDPPALGVQP